MLIQQLRDAKEWRQSDLAERLGVTQATVSRWETGDVVPKAPERRQLANIFAVSFEEFERRWRETEMPPRVFAERGIPVINRGPAGQVHPYEECFVTSGEGFEYLDWGNINDDLAFAVIITGKSMEPRLHEGDYVIFSQYHGVPKPRAKLEPGRVVYVRFAPESKHDGCTIARYQPAGNGAVMFVKDNPEYPPILARREEIEQLAVAIQVRTSRGI